MNWAMGARTDGVSAQCVLFVVADTANEHGISIHADPDYIAARTRQSRATVFRRLKELEQVGALTRLKRYREDGAPVYEIRLNLDADVDYEAAPADDGQPQDIEPESQIETHGESQPETGKVSPVRQAKSQSCDSKSPSKNPEDNPPTPQGGIQAEGSTDQEAERRWAAFKSSFEADGEPIAKPSLVKPLLNSLTPEEFDKVLRATRGLLAWRRSQKKPPAKIAAQNFVREIDAWDGWAGHAPPELPPPTFIADGTAEARALAVLDRILDRSSPQSRFNVERGASGYFRVKPVPPDLLGLAAVADKPVVEWCVVESSLPHDTGPFTAWAERIARAEWTGKWPEPQRIMLDGFTTIKKPDGSTFEAQKRTFGLRVPCLYPPRKDGTLSGSTDPPQSSAG